MNQQPRAGTGDRSQGLPSFDELQCFSRLFFSVCLVNRSAVAKQFRVGFIAQPIAKYSAAASTWPAVFDEPNRIMAARRLMQFTTAAKERRASSIDFGDSQLSRTK
jgi:hypothetical protein